MKVIDDKELNTISKRIKYARLANNMTMQELADTMHKKYQTVQQYEKGIRNPKDKMINDIAKGLKVSPIFLKNGGYVLKEDKNALLISMCVDKKLLRSEKGKMYTAAYSKDDSFTYDTNLYCLIIEELIKRINKSHNPEYIILIKNICELAMKSIDKNYNEDIIEISDSYNEENYAKRT